MNRLKYLTGAGAALALAVSLGMSGYSYMGAPAAETDVTLTEADLNAVKAIAEASIAKTIEKVACKCPVPPAVDPNDPKVDPPGLLTIEIDQDSTPGQVEIKADGKFTRIRWKSATKFRLYEKDRVAVFPATPGEHTFHIAADSPDELDLQCHVVQIGPPKPVDPPRPVDPPVVVPTGPVNVLIVEETLDRGKPELKPFLPVLQSTAAAAYVLAHKAKVDFRQVDDDEALKGLPAKWKTAADAPRASLPWLTVTDSTGKVIHSAELPKAEADFLALLRKWGE